jgi:hypothetical protein
VRSWLWIYNNRIVVVCVGVVTTTCVVVVATCTVVVAGEPAKRETIEPPTLLAIVGKLKARRIIPHAPSINTRISPMRATARRMLSLKLLFVSIRLHSGVTWYERHSIMVYWACQGHNLTKVKYWYSIYTALENKPYGLL